MTPVEKVPGGYRYGKTGKVYKNPKQAYAQGAAIEHAQARRGKTPDSSVAKRRQSPRRRS